MLFGQYDIGKLYRETINVCVEGIKLTPSERAALYAVACLSEIGTGICYDPDNNRPADHADLFAYAACDKGAFHDAMERLARLSLIHIWSDRGHIMITLNEYIRSSMELTVNKRARPALIIQKQQSPENPTTSKRFGYVYIARAENGLHKIGRAKDPEARVRGFAGAVMPFVIELIHTIPSNDCIQAESLLHQRYRQCRRVGEWFELSERDLDKILDTRQLNF